MSGLVTNLEGTAAGQAAALVEQLRAAQRGLLPFASEVADFAADLSRRLRRLGRAIDSPPVSALAFWTRPANLERLRLDWLCQAEEPGLEHLPRGVVFHIPPTNVDTLFVYSWLLSALAGNANVIRLAPAALEPAVGLLQAIEEALAEHPAVQRTTAFVTYGRSAEITGALSSADMRVIWGGDETVAAIRSIPLPPRSVELAFADRFSFAVIDAGSLLRSDQAGDAALASRLFNDAYWFDQMGCSSPRAVIWRGSELDTEAAADRLWAALSAEIERRRYSGAEGVAVAKLLHLTGVAMAGDLQSSQWLSGEVAVGELKPGAWPWRDSPGGGLFYSVRIDDLKQLAEWVRPSDQTLTYFGFQPDELHELALDLGAAGVDRIVPIGSALDFDRFWDGHDLLAAFTRILRIQV